MKVWQFGTHLTDERGARVEDWSWRQTRRRLRVLVAPRAPVPGADDARGRHPRRVHARRAPPAVPRQARRRRGHPGGRPPTLSVIVAAFVAAGVAAFALSGAQTYLTGWVGERALADLRIRLFGHLQRLSLGFYERNRTGAIVSRITNDVEALDQLVTDGVSSLVQNSARARGHGRRSVPARLAPRARDARRPPAHGPRDRLVPLALQPRLPPRAGASRARHGHARGGHLRHARRPVLHA